MKNYTLTTQWSASDMSKVDAALLMQLQDESLTMQQRQELLEAIQAAAVVEIPEAELSELDELYQSVKPELKEGDDYLIISMDASRDQSGGLRGILNCRVNGEHKQIRF